MHVFVTNNRKKKEKKKSAVVHGSSVYYAILKIIKHYAAVIHDTKCPLALNQESTHYHPNHHDSHPNYRLRPHPPGRGTTRPIITHVTPPPIIPYCDTTNRAVIHTYHGHIHHLVRAAIRQTQVLRCTGLKECRGGRVYVRGGWECRVWEDGVGQGGLKGGGER